MTLQLDHDQITGAVFLAERKAALLADEPGFGKTAQAIAACDLILAKKVLVVTTASARVNWVKEFDKFSGMGRSAAAWLTTTPGDRADVTVVAWSNVMSAKVLAKLSAVKWDVLILDESHYAKSLDARRTKVVYGVLAPRATHVWCLSGTPQPNAPHELYPMLRTLQPGLIEQTPNFETFTGRYCVVKPRFINGVRRDVFIGGKNENELREKLIGFMLRRKLPLAVDIRFATAYVEGDPSRAEDQLDAQAILDAAETGDTNTLDMHLGPLRRETGLLKATGAVALAKDALDNGQDKIVLFAWHHAVLDTLYSELADYNPVRLDGRTPAHKREAAVQAFQTNPTVRVFVAQIQAAGEAITLTAANRCLFIESSFVPKDMQQAVRRIYRRGQTRPCLCQVVTLDGSIDEALSRIVIRKMASIRKTMEPTA